ncbi:LOW QUALITY PROTEIN: NACHT, LRR and PYD domains-containing protein 3-like [Carcharodon carcharias]|uniref:LOW QUALITY PROTEIN: NACHT, LRR and PYD domains-containing protein 3-like n=1 Tax=Carcharodon carcharias TaxID=13397 RepID=UPI001B7E3F23|nr:LOW QUALITY PROTEIN: NACHT, LRR and PYD domains-containing protein 3-like [Carcharodon carcharias]
MAEGQNETEYPMTTKRMRMATDPNSRITEFLTKWDDFQLFQLTKFYWDRLDQAIEEGVDGVSSLLTYEQIFNGQEHRKVTELTDKGNRADSSKLLLSLVMEKGSRARRVMWESFVKVHHGVPKLDKIIKEIQELGSDPFDYMNIGRGLSEIPSHLKGVQQKHKEILRVQTETLRENTILIKEKVKIFQLIDRYTELTIISNVRDRTLVEHELLARGRDHEEWREKHLRRELEKIRTDQLFQSSFSLRKSKSGSSAAVSGVPGIRKTTMVQKIVYGWATGKIYPHFQFVFSFKFRDLNTINCRINLRNLILFFYPYFGSVLGELWKNPEGLLFIFDGLDEFKDRIDFADNRRNTEPQSMCTDPECRCKVSDIVYSLIQHKLLPGCTVLVTSRPTALHLLKKAEISVWAEILGFVGEERKEYFNKYFEDQAVAAAVFKYVEENEILYALCYNPSYCWILGLSLGPFFTQRDRKQLQIHSKTSALISDVVSMFPVILGKTIKSDLTPVPHLHCENSACFNVVLTSLFRLSSNNLGDLGVKLLSAALRNPGCKIQELELCNNPLTHSCAKDVASLVSTNQSLTKLDLSNNKLKDSGVKLLSAAVRNLGSKIQKLRKNIRNMSGCRSFGPTSYYGSYFFVLVQQDLENFLYGNDLTDSDAEDLASALSTNRSLTDLKLSNNKLGDSGVKLFSVALRDPDCKIQKLCLGDNTLTDSCAEDLASVFNHSLTHLNLADNKLGDSGVKRLSVALRGSDCKIQKLDLSDNDLSDSCAEDLASALSTKRSLTNLSPLSATSS